MIKQGQLLLGLQGLHFHIQTLDKVASGGRVISGTRDHINGTHDASMNNPTIFKGKVLKQALNLGLQWQIPSDGLDLNN